MRILALLALFAAEAGVASIFLDGAAPVPQGAWLTLLVHRRGALVARCAIGFAALFATFAYLRYGPQLTRISKLAAQAKIGGAALTTHAIAMLAFAVLSPLVYGGRISPASSNLASAAWLIAGIVAVVSAAMAALPLNIWRELTSATGWLWCYSGAVAIAAGWTFPLLRLLWQPTAKLTFWIVQFIGRPFFGDMVVQPENLLIGTHRFKVIVADECSGLEGIGLLLVFAVIWLVLFRDEIRLGRALLLLPVGTVALFLLNSVRILGLLAIGNAGAKSIAAGGFHSQAGWLAFNSVAFALCVAARNLQWISTHPRESTVARSRDDSTTALLAPFLAILAAGMISRAMSGAFEWWYALRFLAAAVVLIAFRKQYAGLRWRAGWTAAVWGTLVFLMWVALDRVAGTPHAAMPAALAQASPPVRAAWIALRVLGGVVTVPIAEELAFRGYLMRRLISGDFEKVSLQSFTWIALLGSSLIFGFMHGSRWLAGAIAGIIYGIAMVRRGQIGEAVAAHAFTNALLAGCVLVLGQWQFW
jgi:exosortase E/protease (VPEID-CTERM system)